MWLFYILKKIKPLLNNWENLQPFSVAVLPSLQHFLDKMNECMTKQPCRLPALTLLGHVIRKQPSWIHKIARYPLLLSLLKCLKVMISSCDSLGQEHLLSEFWNERESHEFCHRRDWFHKKRITFTISAPLPLSCIKESDHLAANKQIH